MIARIWRGAVRTQDAGEYAAHIQGTGIQKCRQPPGNRGAWLFRRPGGDRAEIVSLSLRDSLQAIGGFAGAGIEKGLYPGDDRFLIERELRVTHYGVPVTE